MNDLTPHQPMRPLLWEDFVGELQDLLSDVDTPIYIVGGAVRDAYLHRPLKDLDLVVPQDGIRVARQIANRMNGDFYAIDPKRGVGRAIVQATFSATFAPVERKLIIDVAAFRGGDTLLDDLRARDFTMNAMVVDLRDLERVIDPLKGEEDIKQKTLRQCSPTSIPDDPLRALRAVRQSAQFGYRMEKQTLRAVRAVDLQGVSAERVRDELFAILALSHPTMPLRVMQALGLIDQVRNAVGLPLRAGNDPLWEIVLRGMDRLNEILVAISPRRTDETAASFDLGMMVIQLDRYRSRLIAHIEKQWANDRSHRAILMFGLLLLGVEVPVDDLVERLRLSIEEGRAILAARDTLELLKTLKQGWTPLDLHHFWSVKPRESGLDLCLWALALHLGETSLELDQDLWLTLIDNTRMALEAYYDKFSEIVDPPPLIDGKALMEVLHLKPGRIIGKILDAIREGQVTGSVRTIDDALQVARQIADQP